MSDLISRQAAIDALARTAREKFNLSDEFDHYLAGLIDGEDAIRRLPSAQPEQKTGEWIEKEICETRRKEEMQVTKCSNCGKYLTTPHFYSFTHYSYCPNCGVRMGNTDEQED